MHFSPKRYFYSFVVSVLVITASCTSLQAQRRVGGMNADGNVLGGSKSGSGPYGYITSHGWSVAANGGFELPLGDLRETYKGGPSFGGTLSKKINHNIISASVDYRVYDPKQSVFVDESAGFPISLYYSSFSGLNAYLGVAHEWLITNSASFYAGFNGGYMITKFDMLIETPIGVEPYSQRSNVPFLGPKLGLNFAVSNRIIIGAETRYNFSIGKGNIGAAQGPDISASLKSVAANLSLNYNF